jgi:hypothetical protein
MIYIVLVMLIESLFVFIQRSTFLKQAAALISHDNWYKESSYFSQQTILAFKAQIIYFATYSRLHYYK